MKKLATLALLLMGYSAHAFIHTYIHLAPNYNSCQTELDFSICNETPFTYTMTYNSVPVTALDFPMNGGPSCSNSTGTLYFLATNGSDNYEFELQINYSPTGITLQYLQEPTIRPMTIIQQHQPSNITCSGQVTLTLDGGYLPYQTQWYQNGNPFPAAPGATGITQLCPGQYGYSASDSYTHCGINPPVMRLVDIELFDCLITSSPMSCPEVCDGSSQLVLLGSQSVSHTAITHFDGQNDPTLLANLCAGVTNGFAIHLSGAFANCMPGTVTEPVVPNYELDVVHVSGNGLSNGSAEVTVTSGNGPFSYTWNGANFSETGTSEVNGLLAGNYTLTIGYNSGCELSVDFDVNEPAQLQIQVLDVGDQTEATPNGMISFEITGGVEPYVLFVNDIETSNNGMLTDLSAGVYILNVFDDNLNEAEIEVEIQNTLKLPVNTTELKVFPNPTVNEASISSSEMMKSIQVTSENGQLVAYFQQLDTPFFQLNLSGLSGGIYFVIVDFYSGWKEVLQLVKQ